MKHTYLYPLEDREEWLWQVVRSSTADLFGSPPLEASDLMWEFAASTGDALEETREHFLGLLKDRDRICVGRHYVIPGSQCAVSRERAAEADQTVHFLTHELWDAPRLDWILHTEVHSALKKVAGADGRDDWEKIKGFLNAHREHRIVPVWM